MIHVADLAACVLAFCAPGPSARLYELFDAAPDGHGWRDIVIAASRNVSPRFVKVPDIVLLAAGRAADALSTLSRKPALFGLGKAREILHRDWRPDPMLRPPHPIWQPRTELAAAMRELRSQGGLRC
jgi:hypothetical protein